jgi:outer membrane scaffolding protein for murein synthesis (MipA/OmpV family)
VTVSYDVDEIEGLYAVLAVGHSFELTDKVGLELSASLGFGDKDYNAGYFGYAKAALNDLVFGAALPIAITENISLTPSLSYMLLPDSDLGDAAKAAYGEKDSVFGGVTLSCAF